MRIENWRKKKESTIQTQTRLKVIFWGLALLFLIAFFRIAQIQILDENFLSKLAIAKNSRLKSITIQKGNIVTSDGKLLATSIPNYSVFADPATVKQTFVTAEKLAPMLNISQTSLLKSLTTSNRFVWLKRFVGEDTKEKIQALNLGGIGVVRDFERIYPAQNYLSSILGFSNKDGLGLEGMENSLDSYLVQDNSQNKLISWIYDQQPTQTVGNEVVLTINDNMQHILEQEVAEFAKNMQPESSLALLLDSKTSKILAAASTPSYNPNIYNLYKNKELANPFFGKLYEPGSTFKLITLATALDKGVINSSDKFDCELGKKKFYDHVIKDTMPMGIANLSQIISHSSNICAAKIGLKLSAEDFYEGIKKFNLTNPSNIDLNGEVSSQLRAPNKWRKIDQAILSFGQGIGITPLQLVSAVNVFANDGKYIAPSIIDHIQDEKGNIIKQSGVNSAQIIKPEVATLIKSYMEGVVKKGATGYFAAINGLNIAAKTGTAQKFDTKSGKYMENDSIHSIVGFFPAEKPIYTALVIINSPKKGYLGTKTASILFREITKRIMLINHPIAKQTIASAN